MMVLTRHRRRLVQPGVCLAMAGCSLVLAALLWSGSNAQAQSETPVSFASDVLPILQRSCFECHGATQQMSDLDLRSRGAMLEGGALGPSVVPGHADESRLYRRVAGLEDPPMPMDGSLSRDEIRVLRDWINQGAKVEGDGAWAGGSPRDWWAFKKPVRSAVPQVNDPRWSKNPIDAFIFAKLVEKGLTPAPRADKATLVRRAYLDLHGLLPTPQDVDAFVKDDAPDAFARLVDRLLASPHYGERWGRHWLDVARYADSGGYEHDFDYPHAWRYRDYVIRAFNDDKPYDDFIREQLAGDELDTVTYDTLIATGFNRVGPTVGFREKDNPQYRYTYLDDMVGTASRAFMGLTVNCARCHDHKFDPISKKEYYQMVSMFFPYVSYNWPLAPKAQVEAYEKKKATVASLIAPLQKEVRSILEPYNKQAFDTVLRKFPADVQQAVRTPDDQRTPGQKLFAAQIESIGVAGEARKLLSKEHASRIKELEDKIKEIQKELPAEDEMQFAMGIRDGDYRFTPDGAGDEPLPGKGQRPKYDVVGTFLPTEGQPYDPPRTQMLTLGDYQSPEDFVDPGFVSVVTTGQPVTSIKPTNGHITSGRRRALAEWFVSKDHPLTARVMVNRIWHHHFGSGIVATPSNFGQLGQFPTHPELLDWLANEFVGRKWSMKAMHRLMMNTETYQMASAYQHAATLDKDPRNQYLWRFRQRRLESEIIRDVILSASGKLNPEMGGKPFFIPIEPEVRHSYPKGEWPENAQGPGVWRRGIYSYFKRGLRVPMFDVFDMPDLNVTSERRVATTVPTQALTLMNNRFILEQAGYLAERVATAAGPDDAARIRAAYRIAVSRDPRPKEVETSLAFLARQAAYHQSRPPTARGPYAADPSMSALTDLCDVILNLNEFVYIN